MRREPGMMVLTLSVDSGYYEFKTYHYFHHAGTESADLGMDIKVETWSNEPFRELVTLYAFQLAMEWWCCSVGVQQDDGTRLGASMLWRSMLMPPRHKLQDFP